MPHSSFAPPQRPGARICAGGGNCGARLAADAFVSRVIQRQVVDFFARGVFPNLPPGPCGERTDFQQGLAAGQLMIFDDFQIGSRGRLFAAQSRKPEIEFFETCEQRLDFAQMAASSGIGTIENSERGFLFGNGLFCGKILHVEIPLARHFGAIRVGFREVVAGIEKKYGNIGNALAQHVENDHVLGLEAAGDADRTGFHRRGILREQTVDAFGGGQLLELFGQSERGHDFPLSASSEKLSRHLRRTFMIRSTASSSVSSVMRTAKNESGPKIARTTCFWSVPSSSGQNTVM